MVCGVLSLGVLGPNAPIELGTKREQFSSFDTSSALYNPFTFIFQSRFGFYSPTADSIAAR